MKAESGIALILALLFLSLLTILGGALLTKSTIDVWISDNYKTGTQNLYLTEAGIDQARETMRGPLNSPDQFLRTAAGANGTLSKSTDLATLLASDDQPLIPSDPTLRSTGQALTDNSGKVIGHYHVWLRNDNADGIESLKDTNQVLTLLSFGRIRNAHKTIEVTIKRTGFPSLRAALTLDGPIDVFDAPSSQEFEIESLGNADSAMSPPLESVAGLENLVTSISALASDVYNPEEGSPYMLGNYGSPSNYRVAVVNGDVDLGFGGGYGMLVARGEVTMRGNFTWNGLILIIGQGVLHWSSGSVNGGVFIARTRSNDRTSANPLGTLLATRGGISADFRNATGNGIHYDAAAITAANELFPYVPIGVKER